MKESSTLAAVAEGDKKKGGKRQKRKRKMTYIEE